MRTHPIAAPETAAARGVMDPTPEQWERIKDLLAEATTLSAHERKALVERVRCESGDTIADGLAELLQNVDLTTQKDDQPFVPPLLPFSNHSHCFEEGELVQRRFRILRFLGSGGMSEVYQAHDERLGPVALKTIRSDLVGDRNALRRFEREVELARKVKHRHVCSIYDLFVVEPDQGSGRVAAFLTMELLSGITLRERIQRGPLRWAEAERLILEICQGMEAIHESGIIHRDLKPGNVMLAASPGSNPHNDDALHAVVMDFGLAVQSQRRPGDKRLTRSGGVLGTFDYMAPEQLRGESAKICPATDVYAMGLVIYETLAGKRPFSSDGEDSTVTEEATTVSASRGARGSPLLRPVSSYQPGIPPHVDQVIAKCLAFDPADRYQSAGDVAKALAEPGLTKEASKTVPGPAQVWPRSTRILAAAVLALLILGIGVARFVWPSGYTPNPAAQSWYDRGVASFQAGLYLTAKAQFEEALKKDSNFGMARVRLAEALNELDFRGDASKVMAQLTGEQENRLNSDERNYAEAVRATLAQNFKAAVTLFRRVFDNLPRKNKAAGYVYLGRADEKAGKISEALDAYAHAKQLASDSPTAYLRSAVLESRQGKNQKADDDFSGAADLFQKLGALEGRAEVAYQRSYWQSVLGNYAAALQFAQQSLDAARQMKPESVQLEVRARCRFSAISHGEGREDVAFSEAAQAIELAHQNGLEYWETDARLRQGAADYGKRDFAAAEKADKSALAIATSNQWPRLIALAQLNLATLRDWRGQDQDMPGLKAAAEYYKTYQFPTEYRLFLLLQARGANQMALYEDARKAGIELLDPTRKSGNAYAIAQTEELLGSAFMGLQDYVSALEHFDSAAAQAQRALESARRAGSTELIAYEQLLSYEQLHRADALARLARFDEADGILLHLDNDALAGQPNRIRARLFCLSGKYEQSVGLVRGLLKSFPGLDPYAAADVRIIGSTAEARAGKLGQARIWVQEAREFAERAKDGAPDAETVAFVDLAQAEVNRLAGSPQAARSSAEHALAFFHAHAELESEWMSWHEIALAEKTLKLGEAAWKAARNSLDILSTQEHSWGNSERTAYESRPDVLAAVTRLRSLTKGR